MRPVLGIRGLHPDETQVDPACEQRRAMLGWEPRHARLIADLEEGRYFRTA